MRKQSVSKQNNGIFGNLQRAIMKVFIFFILFISISVIASELSEFYVETSKSISAMVLLKDNDSLLVSVLNGNKNLSTEDIDVSSEENNHILSNDCNRDGYKDFSI